MPVALTICPYRTLQCRLIWLAPSKSHITNHKYLTCFMPPNLFMYCHIIWPSITSCHHFMSHMKCHITYYVTCNKTPHSYGINITLCHITLHVTSHYIMSHHIILHVALHHTSHTHHITQSLLSQCITSHTHLISHYTHHIKQCITSHSPHISYHAVYHAWSSGKCRTHNH